MSCHSRKSREINVRQLNFASSMHIKRLLRTRLKKQIQDFKEFQLHSLLSAFKRKRISLFRTVLTSLRAFRPQTMTLEPSSTASCLREFSLVFLISGLHFLKQALKISLQSAHSMNFTISSSATSPKERIHTSC